MHERFGILLLVLLAACKTPSDQRGSPGMTGERGEKGDKGGSGDIGADCRADKADKGVIVVCEGKDPSFIPFATDGASGTNGGSCTAKALDEGATITCSDPDHPGSTTSLTLKSGKAGASCAAAPVPGKPGQTKITCGTTEYLVADGANGARGAKGPTGFNYITKISDVSMEALTTSSYQARCSFTHTTTDPSFLDRNLSIEFFKNDVSWKTSKTRPQYLTGSNGRVTGAVDIYGGEVNAGDNFSCQVTLFDSGTTAYFKSDLTPKISVANDGKTLASSRALKYTAISADEVIGETSGHIPIYKSVLKVTFLVDTTYFSSEFNCRYQTDNRPYGERGALIFQEGKARTTIDTNRILGITCSGDSPEVWVDFDHYATQTNIMKPCREESPCGL